MSLGKSTSSSFTSSAVPDAKSLPLQISKNEGVTDSTSCRTWLAKSKLLPSSIQCRKATRHVVSSHRIESVEWFIKDQELRIVCNRLRELGALAHPS